MYSLKLSFNQGKDVRRVSIQDPQELSYNELTDTVRTLFSNNISSDCDFILNWVDDEGDEVVVSSDIEVREACSVMLKLKRTCIKFYIRQIEPLRSTVQIGNNSCDEKPTPSEQYGAANIKCSKCGVYPITGVQYRCSVVPSITLCMSCESNAPTPRFPMLKVYTPKQETVATEYLRLFNSPLPPHGHIDRRPSSEDSWRASRPPPPPSKLTKPMARFIRDVTLPDGSQVEPLSVFHKTWRVRNDGTAPWPPGCALVNAGGDRMFSEEEFRQPVGSLRPGEEGDLTVELMSPGACGRYVGYFRLQTDEQRWFGQRLWADIRVKEDTQQKVEMCSEKLDDRRLFGSGEVKSENVERPLLVLEDKGAPCPWEKELDVLRSMGFTDKDAVIPVLQSHSKPGRTNAEILQRTVADILTL
mmetsp:Transcript_21460/g.31122  ORF Transcript_21460/g.31122 Transcript_21460/m.31122 type:complete len:415 (+) Transcript_21460:94-1338(+)